MLWLKRLIIAAFLLTCGIYAFLICLRNHALVDVDLLFILLPQVKVELLIISSFCLGGLAGLLAATAIIWRIRRKYRVALFKVNREKNLITTKS